MTLDQYLTKTGETDAAFASRAGLSQTQINRLKRGKSSPSFETIKKIASASRGKVKFADWAEQVKVDKAELIPASPANSRETA